MEKVIIFGTGNKAREFLYKNRYNIEVVAFLDNNRYAESLLDGIQIYSLDSIDNKILRSYPIVICCLKYVEIATQLKIIGLVEMVNFFPYEIFRKKPLMIIGNCHVLVIREILRSNIYFDNEYGIINLPEIFNIKSKEEQNCYINLLKIADVVIQQDIKDDNKINAIFGISFVKEHISKNCKHIIMINTYGLGKIYYPDFTHQNLLNKGWLGEEDGYFPFCDMWIDALVSEGKKEADIINILENEIRSFDVQKNADNLFAKYKKREQKCDIKIVEFIEERYKDKLMFYDIAHPVNEVFYEIAYRICEFLDVDISDNWFDITNVMGITKYATPIYKYVKEGLKLKFRTNNDIGESRRITLTAKKMNLKEYVSEYCFWCWREKIKENERNG